MATEATANRDGLTGVELFPKLPVPPVHPVHESHNHLVGDELQKQPANGPSGALPVHSDSLPVHAASERPFGGLPAPSWLTGQASSASAVASNPEPILAATPVSAPNPVPKLQAPVSAAAPQYVRQPTPFAPVGSRLFGMTADGKRCCVQEPELWKWAWEGGKEWLEAASHPVPPSEPCFAPQYEAKCPLCPTRTLRATWKTFSNGTRHLACECARCGKFIGYVREPFKNAWVWWRVAAGQK